MKKLKIEISNERLITPSGLTIVGQILSKSSLVKKAARMKTEKRSQPQIKNGDILLTEIGLLTLGKTSYEHVKEFCKDEEYYKYALGISYGIPSESTLRMRLDDIGTKLNDDILEGNISMLKMCKVQPTALSCGYVPLDIDVTPFDNSKTKKEGVSRTYKGFDGYAPIMAYIGTEGYLCNCELREGKQHCQNGTPEFLEKTIKAAKQMTDKTLLFRLDSGNDSLDNIVLLHWSDPQLKFLIKRNPRRENIMEWAKKQKKECQNITSPRNGKTVYIGSDYRDFHDKKIGNFGVRMVYEIIERTTLPDGQMLLEPQYEINMFWTSLGLSDEEVIELYHNHAVCEQFHSEIKTDMDVERLPSSKFDTNALFLQLAMIAYNVLRIIGTEAMKKQDMPIRHITIKRRRIKTVIENLMLIAGHLTSHAHNLILSLGRSTFWADTFIRIYNVFAGV